jgi:hypothetical protein
MMEWRWNSSLLAWQFCDNDLEIWVVDHPRLPDWFIESQGELVIHKFVEIWQQANSLNEVKKSLFWMPVQEIEEYAEWVNTVLEGRGIKKLQPLKLQSVVVLSESQVDDLISRELLEKEAFYEPDGDVYDPVKALLRAQSKRESRETPHIQTLEVGGRYTFKAKH